MHRQNIFNTPVHSAAIHSKTVFLLLLVHCLLLFYHLLFLLYSHNVQKPIQSQKDSKDQESIQSSTTQITLYIIGKKRLDIS